MSVADLLTSERVLGLSERCFRIYTRVLCECMKRHSDGYLSSRVLTDMGVRPKELRELADATVWKALDDGIAVVDYLVHCPSRAKVEASREAGRRRVRRHRNGECNAVTPPVTRGVTDAVTTTVTDGVTSPGISPTPPLFLSGSESSLDPEPSSPLSSSSDLTGSARESETRAKVLVVFECWQATYGKKNSRLDRKRDSRIRARLREGFSPEQLCEAIRNAKNDPFLMGQNDTGRPYVGIQTLLRDAEQVERLAGLKEPLKPKPRGSLADYRAGPERHSVEYPAFKPERPLPASERLSAAEILELAKLKSQRNPEVA